MSKCERLGYLNMTLVYGLELGIYYFSGLFLILKQQLHKFDQITVSCIVRYFLRM